LAGAVTSALYHGPLRPVISSFFGFGGRAARR